MGVVLRGSSFMKVTEHSTALHHPAAADVAKFCREEIEKCGGTFLIYLSYQFFRAGNDCQVAQLLPRKSLEQCE